MSKISKDLLDSIPPFLTVDVPLWFCLFESAMLVHKIDTEDLKFHILICSLPPKIALSVRAHIVNKSPIEPYSNLRNAILLSCNIQTPNADRVASDSFPPQPDKPSPNPDESRRKKRSMETASLSSHNLPPGKVPKIRQSEKDPKNKVTDHSKSTKLIDQNEKRNLNAVSSEEKSSAIILIKPEPMSTQNEMLLVPKKLITAERSNLDRSLNKNSTLESGKTFMVPKGRKSNVPKEDFCNKTKTKKGRASEKINTEMVVVKPKKAANNYGSSKPEVPMILESDVAGNLQSRSMCEDESAFFDEDLNLLEIFRTMESNLTTEIEKVSTDETGEAANDLLTSHEPPSDEDPLMQNCEDDIVSKEAAIKMKSCKNVANKNMRKSKSAPDKQCVDINAFENDLDKSDFDCNESGKKASDKDSKKSSNKKTFGSNASLEKSHEEASSDSNDFNPDKKKIKIEMTDVKFEYVAPNLAQDSRKSKIFEQTKTISRRKSSSTKSSSTVGPFQQDHPAEQNLDEISDPPEIVSAQLGLFKCNICKSYFGNYTDALVHVSVRHGDRQISDDRPNPMQVKTSNRVHKLAASTIKSRKNPVHRMRTRPASSSLMMVGSAFAKKKEISCKICGKIFDRISKLNLHMRNVHQNVCKYLCPVCPVNFKHSLQLMLHCRSIHKENSPFWCQLCDEKFLLRTKLIQHHLSNHANVKQGRFEIRCLTCFRNFPNFEQFKNHFRGPDETKTSENKSEPAEQASKASIFFKDSISKPKCSIEKSKVSRAKEKSKSTKHDIGDNILKQLNGKILRIKLHRLSEKFIRQAESGYFKVKLKKETDLTNIKQEMFEDTAVPAILDTFQVTQQIYENIKIEMDDGNLDIRSQLAEEENYMGQIPIPESGQPETEQLRRTSTGSVRPNPENACKRDPQNVENPAGSILNKARTQEDKICRDGSNGKADDEELETNLENTVQRLSKNVLNNRKTFDAITSESAHVDQSQDSDNADKDSPESAAINHGKSLASTDNIIQNRSPDRPDPTSGQGILDDGQVGGENDAEILTAPKNPEHLQLECSDGNPQAQNKLSLDLSNDDQQGRNDHNEIRDLDEAGGSQREVPKVCDPSFGASVSDELDISQNLSEPPPKITDGVINLENVDRSEHQIQYQNDVGETESSKKED